MRLTSAEMEVAAVVAGAGLAAWASTALGRRARSFAPRTAAMAVAVLAAVVFAGYGTLAVLKLGAYNMGAEDLGRMDQAIYSVLRGEPLVFSAPEVDGPMSRLAGHVELLYVALAPLFLLWNSATALLVAQAAAVVLGAWPAYRLGVAAQGPGLGFAAAFAYLAHPAVGFAVLSDIHGDTFAMPLLLLAVERALAGQRLASLAAWILALSAKEYVAAMAVAFGLYLLWARRDRRLPLTLVAVGLLWLLVVVPVVHRRFRPPDFPELTPRYFGRLGTTPAEVVGNSLRDPWLLAGELVTPRKLGVIALLLAPFAYAPLVHPLPLLVATPVLLPLAATVQLNLRNHHNATLIPFLLLAALGGARRLWGPRAPLALIAASTVTHLTLSPSPFSIRSWTPGRWDYLLNPHQVGRTAHDAILDQALARVPPHARISASSHLAPHLSHREVCFAFPAPLDYGRIDLAVIDLLGAYPASFRPRSVELLGLERLLADPRFRLLLARDGVFVLDRTGTDLRAAPPGGGSVAAGSYAVGPLRARVGEDGSVLWETTRPIDQPILILDAATRDVRLAALSSVPWSPGQTRLDPIPIRPGSRLVVLELHEGFPGLDPRHPPQPWLPDSALGERLFR